LLAAGPSASSPLQYCAKSFFKTLKRELQTLDGRHSEAEVRQPVFMYLEAYYNRVRIPLFIIHIFHYFKIRFGFSLIFYF
jgi:hypothetical protein